MMLFLMVKEPYTITVSDKNGTEIPMIEMYDARNFQIKQGIVENIVHAERIFRFDRFDELLGIHAWHQTKEGLKGILVSDAAVVQNNVIHFKKNSRYERDDGVSLIGDDIFYDFKKEVLTSDNPFIFSQKQSRTEGLSFVYQMKEGTISATNIHSFIQQVGKKK